MQSHFHIFSLDWRMRFSAQKLEPHGRLSTMILDDTLTPASVVYVDRQMRNGKVRNRGGSIAGVGSHFLGAWSSIHISIFHCQNTKLAAPWNSCLIHFIHSRELTYVTYPIQRAFGKMSFLSHLVEYVSLFGGYVNLTNIQKVNLLVHSTPALRGCHQVVGAQNGLLLGDPVF